MTTGIVRDIPNPMNRAIPNQPLSCEEFLVHYNGDNRFELIDGEVFDLEPTGLHEEVAALITTKIYVQIDSIGLPWFVLQRGLLRPDAAGMTAFWPDVAVIDRIGKLKQPTLSICLLVDGEYEIQQLRGDQPITSPTFPRLQLSAAQVLSAGR
jgi:Uma2 family endonuclease